MAAPLCVLRALGFLLFCGVFGLHRRQFFRCWDVYHADGIVKDVNLLCPFAVNLFRACTSIREINSFKTVGVSSVMSVYFRTLARKA